MKEERKQLQEPIPTRKRRDKIAHKREVPIQKSAQAERSHFQPDINIEFDEFEAYVRKVFEDPNKVNIMQHAVQNVSLEELEKQTKELLGVDQSYKVKQRHIGLQEEEKTQSLPKDVLL